MPAARYLEDRACKKCGSIFRPRRAEAAYCSRECWGAEIRTEARKCRHCAQDFKPRYAQQTYCSVECKNAGISADKRCVCAQCGAEFERPHGKPRAYCSRACAAAARKEGKVAVYKKLSGVERSGRSKTTHGYIAVRTDDGRRVLEHRLVMEQKLGRPLMPHERVHHVNGNRADNRPENLELWVGGGKKDPSGQRMTDLYLAVLTHPRVAGLGPEALDAVGCALRDVFRLHGEVEHHHLS